MRPGRELDTRISQEVFGYEVFVKQKQLHERTPKGDRPLRNYSKEIEWAWEVAKKMNMTVIPVEGGEWFAIAGKETGWSSPTEFVEYLQSGQFKNSGAAVGSDAPLTICMAAINAIENRRAREENEAAQTMVPQPEAETVAGSGAAIH